MKRTLFKLGWYFEVESRTETEAFVLEQDVREWRRAPGWEFEMLSDTETRREAADTGTTITVTRLRTSVAEDLGSKVWEARLRADVRTKHRRALDRGMQITVNGVKLEPVPMGLHESEDLKPIVRDVTLDEERVRVRLPAGVSSYKPADAGWYVFLNDRLVVGPDRTALTVWEGRGSGVRGGGVSYHDQFARFRGFALLDSDISDLLPWTSTKTGVDADSPTWRRTRQLMREMTRPVIDFLNQLDREKTYLAGDARAGQEGVDPDPELARQVIAEQIDRLASVDLSQVTGAPVFVHPQVTLASLPPQQTWIRYRVPTPPAAGDRVGGGRRRAGGPEARRRGAVRIRVLPALCRGRVSSPSWRKVPYGTRPAKHVERKMLAEAMARLDTLQPLEDWRYVGLGSLWFTDFALFHRRLGVRLLHSIEDEQDEGLKQRFRDNAPFATQMHFGKTTSQLPKVPWDRPAVVWLDYDDKFRSWMFEDVDHVVSACADPTLLLFTLNVSPGTEPGDGRRAELAERLGSEDRLPKWARRDSDLGAELKSGHRR